MQFVLGPPTVGHHGQKISHNSPPHWNSEALAFMILRGRCEMRSPELSISKRSILYIRERPKPSRVVTLSMSGKLSPLDQIVE